jgi:hypothetical protein
MAEYIKREAVMKIIDDYGCTHDGTLGSHSGAVDVIGSAIYKLPVVDVAPVRHGRWYNRGGRFRCSVCDNKTLLKDIGGTGGWSHEYEQQKSPYCPNCGAKMTND